MLTHRHIRTMFNMLDDAEVHTLTASVAFAQTQRVRARIRAAAEIAAYMLVGLLPISWPNLHEKPLPSLIHLASSPRVLG